MDVLFPRDLRGPDKQENPKVAGFLVKTFPVEYQTGAPEKAVRDCVTRLMVYLEEKKPWAIVKSKELAPPHLLQVAIWTVIAYACTKEQKAIYTSYTDIVDSIRTDGEVADAARRTPFLIVLFPEMVQCADWARAKFLDMIIQKKHVVIITTNPQEMDLVFGDVLVKTIRAFTGTDVVTF